MFRLTHTLYFPQLIRSGETTFKAHSDVSRSTTIYKLDWETVDKIRQENYEKRTIMHSDEVLPPFPGTLPEEYWWVTDLRFALPRNYLDQIRYCTRQAMEIWGKEYGFDTMIREICLEPAVAHSYVAFRLLADCIYDEKTNYWSRDDNRIIVPQALLYKFWSFQTGRGMVREHAKFNKLTWRLKDRDPSAYAGLQGENDSKTNEVMKFITAIDSFEKELEKCMPRLGDGKPATGPSLGEAPSLTWEPNQNVSSSNYGGTLTINQDSSVFVDPTGDKVFTITSSDGSELFSVSDPAKRPNVKTPVKTTNGNISVIVQIQNDKNCLSKNLASLMKYGFGEIILIDNGSDEPLTTEDLEGFEEYKEFTILTLPKTMAEDTREKMVDIAIDGAKNERILFISPRVKLKGFDYSIKRGTSYEDEDTETRFMCKSDLAHGAKKELEFRAGDLVVEKSC